MARSRVVFALVCLVLLSLVLTGCLGQFVDKGRIKALMRDMERQDFKVFSYWKEPESTDLEEFNDNLSQALTYFADPFSFQGVSLGTNPSSNFEFSAEFDHGALLHYESGWDLSDYQDYIRQSQGLDAEDSLTYLTTFIDFNFETPLYLMYDKDDFDPLRITGPVVVVRGNIATWTKSYATQGILHGGHGDTLKRDVSVTLEVELKKGTDSKWKISHVEYIWQRIDEMIEQ